MKCSFNYYFCLKPHIMKETPLKQNHQKAGARMVEFAGYLMPLEYEGVIKEHLAVRNAAGLFDVSHMGEFWIKGSNALKLIQYVSTNDASKLAIGQAQYSCLPNGRGGIIDDLIIYRYEEEKYMLVVNAANIQKDWDWINKHNRFGAKLENSSDEMALIALQGPKAKEVLQKLTPADLDSIQSFHFTTDKVGNSDYVIISATGYTGAGGFELYCTNENASYIWDLLLDAGKDQGLKPAGLAARDTLRLEMGYALYGNDIDDTTSPIEAGLGWIVKFTEGKDFIDREKMAELKTNGVSKKLIGIKLLEKGIPRHGYQVLNETGEVIGEITSGTQSPVLNQGIGMAYLKTEFAVPGNKVFLQVRNRKLASEVVKFPFI